MDVLIVVNALVTILGGILAASAIIVAKRPDAQQLIDKLVPYQAVIGVGMIVLGIINFVRAIPHLTDFFHVNLFWAAALMTLLLVSLLLGILFGMPTIVKLMSGSPPPPSNNPYAQQYQQMMQQQNPGWQMQNKAENKLLELQQKIAPFQIMLGLLALVTALVVLLYQFHIIKYSGGGPI